MGFSRTPWIMGLITKTPGMPRRDVDGAGAGRAGHAQHAKDDREGPGALQRCEQVSGGPGWPAVRRCPPGIPGRRVEGPSSWRTQHNIGLCAQNLERDLEAIGAYERALAMAGKEAEESWRREVASHVAALKAGLVRVTIQVRPPGASLIDERVPVSGKPT